jgi:HD superfamily phosphodiesterase
MIHKSSLGYQQNTLEQIKIKVSEAFKDIQFWPHDIDHVRNVALYGRQIAEAEAAGLSAKMNLTPDEFIFLAQTACWFHDLGRSIETEELRQDKSWNHALQSVEMARKIFDNPLVLQAVEEHNQAFAKHPQNLITRVLQDADRGEGFGFRGMVIVFNYNQIINTRKLITEEECRQELINQWPILMANKELRKKTIHWLGYLAAWFGGNQKVSPLFTSTARKIYQTRFEITRKYLDLAKSWKTDN